MNYSNEHIRYNNDNMMRAVQARGFVIASLEAGRVSMSATPAIHANKQSADAECERLALKNPGKAFIVMQLAGAMVTNAMMRI